MIASLIVVGLFLVAPLLILWSPRVGLAFVALQFLISGWQCAASGAAGDGIVSLLYGGTLGWLALGGLDRQGRGAVRPVTLIEIRAR